MTMRAFGPFNGAMPQPTGMIVGYMRDPASFPYLTYTQLVAAPEIQFMYFAMNSDDAARMPRLNDNAWGYDDYRPTGKGFNLQGEWIESRTQRIDFPYTIGNATQRIWQKGGINVKALFDQIRAGHAQLHRATRCVNALVDAAWTANHTSSLNTLLGTTDSYFDTSSGQELLNSGNQNENFLLIKRAFNIVKRRIHLATNGAVGRQQLYAVIPPVVAESISKSGEMFEALKQYKSGKELIDLPEGVTKNVEDWNIPPRYAGFWLVVEDTARVKIDRQADGSIADVTVASEKDYILDEDSILFVSRPGGLDGVAGGKSFSTLQCWHFNGEARVEAFSEPKHDLVEGHIVMEDKVLTPSLISGFKMTDVLAP